MMPRYILWIALGLNAYNVGLCLWERSKRGFPWGHAAFNFATNLVIVIAILAKGIEA